MQKTLSSKRFDVTRLPVETVFFCVSFAKVLLFLQISACNICSSPFINKGPLFRFDINFILKGKFAIKTSICLAIVVWC